MKQKNCIIAVLVIVAYYLIGSTKVQAWNVYGSNPKFSNDTKVVIDYEMPAFYLEGEITSGNNPLKKVSFDFQTPEARWPYGSVAFAKKTSRMFTC